MGRKKPVFRRRVDSPNISPGNPLGISPGNPLENSPMVLPKYTHLSTRFLSNLAVFHRAILHSHIFQLCLPL